jgi:hypothetical protein
MGSSAGSEQMGEQVVANQMYSLYYFMPING